MPHTLRIPKRVPTNLLTHYQPLLRPMKKNPLVATTGRVAKYLDQLNKGLEVKLLPASCTVCQPKFNTPYQRWEWIEYLYKALAGAAGVSVHLTDFPTQLGHADPADSDLVLTLTDTHPDYPGFAEELGSWSDETPTTNYQYLRVGDDLDSIFKAIHTAMEAGFQGRQLHLDWSDLRPNGTRNDKGMVASGPQSFAELSVSAYRFGCEPTLKNGLIFMSDLNDKIRRGGAYKNGAITASLPITHPLINDYLYCNPQTDHPWLYKSVIIPSNINTLGLDDLLQTCFNQVNYGWLWFEKKLVHRFDSYPNLVWVPSDYVLQPGEEYVFHNVCKEVLIEHSETCYLSHANLGQVTSPMQIAEAMADAMSDIIRVHSLDSQGSYGIYKSAKDDRQVGVGFIGLMNLLSKFGVSYAEFSACLVTVSSMSAVQSGIHQYVTNQNVAIDPGLWSAIDALSHKYSKTCLDIVTGFVLGYASAGHIAHRHGYKRAFCIAPTASCSFEYTDTQGYNCTPNITPPASQLVYRNSEVKENVREANYGPVETSETVPFIHYFNCAEGFQNLMMATGKGHAISLDWWVDMDATWFQLWCVSSLTSTYYRLNPASNQFQDKSNPFGCSECGN